MFCGHIFGRFRKLTQKYPKLVVAGGNAGDDFRFEKCLTFSDKCDNCDVAFAAIDSDILKVETRYLLNWHTIGKELTVTKSIGSRIYEIDDTKILDLYEYYLGKAVRENILTHGTEFPLIFDDGGVKVARAPITVHYDGSLTLAGELAEGTKVKFGYANIAYIEEFNKQALLSKYKYKNEAAYIYTCAARRSMLGNYLNEEVSIINEIAPTAGFVTYGEFFHDTKECSNNLLNITTTYVVLGEGEQKEEIKNTPYIANRSAKDITLKALTTLVARTSAQLDENVNYLQQFEKAVSEASIFSATDENGIIKRINENFEIISGYKQEELLLPQQTNSYSLCCISNTWMLEKVSNFLWICY
jgi:PAS domain-containing protein